MPASGTQADRENHAPNSFLVVLNRAGGALKSAPIDRTVQTIRERLGEAGRRAEIEAVAPPELEAALRRARDRPGFDAVIAGGGDGTVSLAAAVLAGSGRPLGVLPLGTMNLFARDLGLPLDLGEALAALSQARPQAIDLGEVSGEGEPGRIFVHHVSIGLHAWMVRHREGLQHVSGLGKWPAMGVAWMRAFWTLPFVDLALSADGERRQLHTALAIVGNNPFAEGIGPVPEHDGLAGGTLAVYVARGTDRIALMRLAAHLTLGRWRGNPELDCMTTAGVEIGGRKPRLRASVDGEVVMLPDPLRCRIRRGALTVLTVRDRE